MLRRLVRGISTLRLKTVNLDEFNGRKGIIRKYFEEISEDIHKIRKYGDIFVGDSFVFSKPFSRLRSNVSKPLYWLSILPGSLCLYHAAKRDVQSIEAKREGYSNAGFDPESIALLCANDWENIELNLMSSLGQTGVLLALSRFWPAVIMSALAVGTIYGGCKAVTTVIRYQIRSPSHPLK